MSMNLPNEIEQTFRDAIRYVNYIYHVTYKEMAKESGFKESTLKSFVNNEGVHLPDERETLHCMVRLSRWLSGHGCDAIANKFIAPNKHICENGQATADGDLTNEIMGIAEQEGNLIVANRNNSISELEKTARKLGNILSSVNAEIALKKQS